MAAAADEGVPRSALSRRALFGASSAAVAGAAAAAPQLADAKAVAYPRVRLVALARLQVNKPVSFEYPLKGQASVLIDLGRAVPDGVGTKKSIVAYSILCQHMGCPVEYQPALREFVCPCHQSRYDAERLGGIVQGVAMQPLPRVHLAISQGAIWATGVDGLIYGYRNNLHPGKRVGGSK